MQPDGFKLVRPNVFPDFAAALKRRRDASRKEPGFPPLGAGMIESLEARRMMSVSFSNGVLTFTGTTGADTIIGYRIVNGSGDNVYVRRNNATPEIAGPYASSGTGSVTKVVNNGQAGGDNVSVELASPFTYGNTAWGEVLEINGAEDNDTLRGGDLADTIRGEAGDDDVYANGGNDVVYGGYGGMDYVEGGGGNDLMYGGDPNYGGGTVEYENDTLHGQAGNDTLYGEGGDDFLDPGADADFAYGGAGNDTFQGSRDFATDWLDGGTGTDSAGTGNVDYDSGTDSLFNFP